MAKEINLFEQEIDEVSQEINEASIDEAPIGEVSKEKYYQTSFPDILDNIKSSQENQQKEKLLRQQIKRIIEALLFSSSAPIAFNKIREVTDTFYEIRPKLIRDLIQELQNEYMTQQRSFRLEEIAQGFILRTCEEYGTYIDVMHRNKRTEKLTQASAEVLAIIAYKQPVTRPQIDAIRGVDSSGTLQNLLERGLIEAVGRLEAPGRPTLYGITSDFLQHFGLRDLKELPELK